MNLEHLKKTCCKCAQPITSWALGTRNKETLKKENRCLQCGSTIGEREICSCSTPRIRPICVGCKADPLEDPTVHLRRYADVGQLPATWICTKCYALEPVEFCTGGKNVPYPSTKPLDWGLELTDDDIRPLIELTDDDIRPLAYQIWESTKDNDADANWFKAIKTLKRALDYKKAGW